MSDAAEQGEEAKRTEILAILSHGLETGDATTMLRQLKAIAADCANSIHGRLATEALQQLQPDENEKWSLQILMQEYVEHENKEYQESLKEVQPKLSQLISRLKEAQGNRPREH